MSHKRKRSADSTASPLSSSSLFSRSSSPPCIDMDDAPIHPSHPMGTASAWSQPSQQPQVQPRENVSGRCLKRFRDDRPDEHIIHESTLRRLYDAQRAPTPTTISLPTTTPSAQFPQLQLHPVQKSTLHQFWHISKPPPTPPSLSAVGSMKDAGALRCVDCDVSLVGYYGVGMSVDMDVDECVCKVCGRWVCVACCGGIGMGGERRCTGCVGR